MTASTAAPDAWPRTRPAFWSSAAATSATSSSSAASSATCGSTGPAPGITVLTEPAYTGILALNPDVNAALAFPQRFTGWPGFVRTLRRARFTHVLDFDNTEKTALVARATGAIVRATFDRELIKFRYCGFYTHVAKVTNDFYDTHHITETYLALLPAIGVPVTSREVRLVPRPADLAFGARLLGKPNQSNPPWSVTPRP